LGGRVRRTAVRGWPVGKKLARLYLKNNPGMVYMLVIPVTWAVEVGGLWSQVAFCGQSTKPYLRNKFKSKKDLGAWLKW
jgi:hypothetical protein